MNWWVMKDGDEEAVGLSDDDFKYQVSRKKNLVELTVVERAEDKIVFYGVWNRKEKKFEVGRRNV